MTYQQMCHDKCYAGRGSVAATAAALVAAAAALAALAAGVSE